MLGSILGVFGEFVGGILGVFGDVLEVCLWYFGRCSEGKNNGTM